MAICRFLAREAGIGGRNSLEIAMVDEIVDVLQDSIEANVRIPNKGESLFLILLISVQGLVFSKQKGGAGQADRADIPDNPGLRHTSQTL